jgi:hypothetical protein
MGIKIPEQSFVLHNILKTFTPVGSGQSYPFFPPSTAVVCQINSTSYQTNSGACGGAVVEALRYKPEGHGIDSPWCP